MAKSIISSILQSQLGKYVDGLSGDSLQVGLWSGELLLQNLSLKPHALAELDLPITVVKGSIKRIHVIVPWNQLGSSSVQIMIEGVHALVIPNTKLPSPEELKQSKRNRIERAELLRQHDRFAKKQNREGEDESTFLSRLTEKILDNLQITLRDIHFRYEDNVSNPETPFTCGIIIQSFAFQTTDAEGKEVFVDRATRKERFIHKAANLFQLCIYWDRLPKDSTSMSQNNTQQFLLQNRPNVGEEMSKMIHSVAREKEDAPSRIWILQPCSMNVQMTKNETVDYFVAPKYSIQATVSSINFGLSREQYEDMLFVDKAFAGRRAIEAHFMYARCRPFHEVSSRPLDWWDYINLLAITRKRKLSGQTESTAPPRRRLRWSSIHKSCIEGKLYIEAYRVHLKEVGATPDPNSRHVKFIKKYEKIYPIDVIMHLRNVAEDEEMKEESVKKAAAAATPAATSGSGSWYGYFFGGGATTAATTKTASTLSVTDVLTEEGREDLKKAYEESVKKEAHAVPMDCNLVSVKLQLIKGSLALYTHTKQQLMLTRMDGSLGLSMRPSNEWDLRFRLQSFDVYNSGAINTNFHTFCTLSSGAKVKNPSLPCVSVDASMRKKTEDRSQVAGESSDKPKEEEHFKARVNALPLQVMVDPLFVVRLKDFFVSMLPEHQLEKAWSFATSSVSEWIHSDEQEQELLANALVDVKRYYDVELDLNAPVFVVVEDVHKPDSSALVLDLGSFRFKNDEPQGLVSSISSESYHWRVDMTKMQVLLGKNLELTDEDENFSRMKKIVEEFSLTLAMETQEDKSQKLLPPKRKLSSGTTSTEVVPGLLPQVAARAMVGKVQVSLTQDQINCLGRIHSAMLAQIAAASNHNFPEAAPQITAVAAGQGSSSQPTSAVVKSVPSSSIAPKSSKPLKEKHAMHFELLLEEVALNLKETSTKEAFRINLAKTRFEYGIFTSRHTFQARLGSFRMDDMLYDSSSPYFPLASTGNNTSPSEESNELIVVDVIMYSDNELTTHRDTDMLVDMKFNVLDIQWNPSSITLFYRFLGSYMTSLQHHDIPFSPTSATLKHGVVPDIKETKDFSSENSSVGSASSSYEANEKQNADVPVMIIRASLVQFSVTFNKDQLNRQLVKLSMQDATTEYYCWQKKDPLTAQLIYPYEFKGDLGNFVATDLSLTKHPIYTSLLGLDPALKTDHTKEKSAGLLQFSYSYDESKSDKSYLTLAFQSVRFVYFHQQLLELVDYLYEGILGTMVSQTIQSATQLLLKEVEASVIFKVSVHNPNVIFPIRVHEHRHIKICAESLELNHLPRVYMKYHSFDNKTLLESRNSFEIHDKKNIFPVDFKSVLLKNVEIFCSTDLDPLTTNASIEEQYLRILSTPSDLQVDIEDLVSSNLTLAREIRQSSSIVQEEATIESGTTVEQPLLFPPPSPVQEFIPRFSIAFKMLLMDLVAYRRSYLSLVAMIQENFGGEELLSANTTGYNLTSPTASSLRPRVAYSYSRTDIEAATMKLTFAMETFRCRLFDEEISHPVAEIAADQFSVSLNHLANKNPSVTASVSSVLVRDLSLDLTVPASKEMSVEEHAQQLLGHPGDENERVDCLLVSRKPTQFHYEWEEAKLKCQLDLKLEGLRGVVIPQALLDLVDFFIIPSKADTEDDRGAIAPILPTSPTALVVVPPPILNSLSTILKEPEGPAYDMTMNIIAKSVSLVFPQDFHKNDCPQITMASDFQVLYKWVPLRQKDLPSTASELHIQSTLIIDASGIEMLIKNSERQGCSIPGSDGRDPITLVQIIEPCDLHVEISDLFPHAGQQQQIMAFRFSPIEVFLSYNDVCIANDTIETLNASILLHQNKSRKKSLSVADKKSPRASKRVNSSNIPDTASGTSLFPPLAPLITNENDSVSEEKLVEVHRYLTCEVGSMSLTIINDGDGCDMGLAQLEMSRCNFFLNTTFSPQGLNEGASFGTTISGGGGFVTIISYYNPDTRHWHPMCSEWNLDVSVQGMVGAQNGKSNSCGSDQKGENNIQVIVTAGQPLDLTITHGLLEVAASAGGVWNRRMMGGDSKPAETTPSSPHSAANEKKKHAPCVIRNETGLELHFWLTDGKSTTDDEALKKKSLSSGELADLHYTHAVGKGSGVVRKYTSQEREQTGTKRLCIQLSDSSFQPVRGIVFEQLGSRSFPLIDNCGSLSLYSLNFYAKLVDGRIIVSISSQVKIVNKMSMPIQLLVHDPTWNAPTDIGVLSPQQESAIPILLSLGTELRVKPVDEKYTWSAPIPVQTRSNVELKVEAVATTPPTAPGAYGSDVVNDVKSAIFCVKMVVQQSLRVVSFYEPIVLINKLPVGIEFRVKSPLLGSSAASSGVGVVTKGGKLDVGAKSGVWWCDNQQRPLFKVRMEGCESTKWLELLHTYTNNSSRSSGDGNNTETFSVTIKRNDGRNLKLIVQVVETAAKSVHIHLYAEVWFINRTGLDLIYGNESDAESYVPPVTAKTCVGNAQICVFSSSAENNTEGGGKSSSSAPVVRIRMASCGWSSRFQADPRRMSWQDECLTLRTASRRAGENGMLYEFGVSADYSMRHFGSLTTLVSVIPRYLVLNRTGHTVLLAEESLLAGTTGTPQSENIAHHVLAREDVYALYWVGGARSKLRACIVGRDEGYEWSDTFSIDQVNTIDLVIPVRKKSKVPVRGGARASASGIGGAPGFFRSTSGENNMCIQISVKSGGLSQATFVIVVNEISMEDSLEVAAKQQLQLQLQPQLAPSVITSTGRSAATTWNNISLHAQVAGIILTIADKKPPSAEKSQATSTFSPRAALMKMKLVSAQLEDMESVARLTISRIRGEFTATPKWKQGTIVVGSLKIEDLLKKSKNPIVLRPLETSTKGSSRNSSFSSNSSGGSSGSGAGGPPSAQNSSNGFLFLNYVEKIHPKYTWVEKLSVEIQDVKLTTSMKFVDRLNCLLLETMSHFQSSSGVSFSKDEEEDDGDENLLQYFATGGSGTGQEEEKSAMMASITGEKIYIRSCVIHPVRVVVSFSRDKGDTLSSNFWLRNIKVRIENAFITLDAYKLTHALATQESLVQSLASFYVKSVKSQALGLLESIEVTTLVTSMVTTGVTSLVSTILGKTDQTLASNNNFRYEFLTNNQIISKHSRLLAHCQSSAQFLKQIRHLVYDWDSNHTGLEARGCVALGILNNSRHSLVINAQLKDGAEIRVLPLGRKHLAGVGGMEEASSMATGEGGFQLSRNEWRADRSVVIFAYGYTPTLLTSGDVYFHVQSNACNVYVTRKNARLKTNIGYSATFTHQEVQTWWSSNVVIVGDELQASLLTTTTATPTPSTSTSSGSYDLFGPGNAPATNADAPPPSVVAVSTRLSSSRHMERIDEEYEVIFHEQALGIIAKQTEEGVIVRDCIILPSGQSSAALKSGLIKSGDRILSVNGIEVFQTAQFKETVVNSRRPVALRFRRSIYSRSNSSATAQYDLFGETPPSVGQNQDASRLNPSRVVESTSTTDSQVAGTDDDCDLFGVGSGAGQGE